MERSFGIRATHQNSNLIQNLYQMNTICLHVLACACLVAEVFTLNQHCVYRMGTGHTSLVPPRLHTPPSSSSPRNVVSFLDVFFISQRNEDSANNARTWEYIFNRRRAEMEINIVKLCQCLFDEPVV